MKKVIVVIVVVILVIAGVIVGTAIIATNNTRDQIAVEAAQKAKEQELADLKAEVEQLKNATSSAPAPADQTSTVVANVTVPTNQEMQDMFGFIKLGVKPVFSGSDIAWEPAKWQVQWVNNDGKLLKLKLLSNWEFTVTRKDDSVAVYYGDGVTTIEVKGATLRFLPAYNTPDSVWAHDKKEMLRRENEYSQSRVPAYETVAGNF